MTTIIKQVKIGILCILLFF